MIVGKIHHEVQVELSFTSDELAHIVQNADRYGIDVDEVVFLRNKVNNSDLLVDSDHFTAILTQEEIDLIIRATTDYTDEDYEWEMCGVLRKVLKVAQERSDVLNNVIGLTSRN